MKPIELIVTYTAKPGAREAFVDAVVGQGVLAKVRAEGGCVRYEYFAALEDPDKLLLLESWADQAALDAHSQSEGMAELKQIKAIHILDTQIQRYG